MKILIVPNVAVPYDLRMVRSLANAFNALVHDGFHYPTPLDGVDLAELCSDFAIDVVIQVNRTRDPGTPLPKNVRHISWFQDVYPYTMDGFAEKFKEGDILYALGDADVLGINVEVPCFVGSLFTGVDQWMTSYKPPTGKLSADFSLCAGLPAPVRYEKSFKTDLLWLVDQAIGNLPLIGRCKSLWILRRLLFRKYLQVDYVPYLMMKDMEEIIRGFYRPLRGELNIHQLVTVMSSRLELNQRAFRSLPTTRIKKDNGALNRMLRHYSDHEGRISSRIIRYLLGKGSLNDIERINPIDSALSHFSQTYPRIMDREELVQMAARVSRSLEVYGPGMDLYEFSKPYYKGLLTEIDDLLTVYHNSKINLSNNTHGLGLHSRTFECMAVGGFLFMHESPYDKTVGGMLSSFEPDVHFGSYTPVNFHDEASRWLKDDKSRKQVGENARAVILDKHCWHHRAKQILTDLEN